MENKNRESILFLNLILTIGICGGISFFIDKEINLIAGVWIIGIIILFFIIKGYYLNQVKYIIDFAERISNGDVTARISPKSSGKYFHVGKLLDNYSKGMKSNMGKILMVSEKLEALIEKLVSDIESIKSGARNVSENIQDVAMAIEKISVGAMNTAEDSEIMRENIDSIKKLSEETVQQSLEMLEGINESNISTMDFIDKMKNASDENIEIAKEVNDLSIDMKRIEDILAIIVSISEKTNLLALNASIEAARAGEHGRGFAVVAEEVRNLAEQSNESGETIKKVVLDITRKTKSISEIINRETEVMKVNILDANTSLKVMDKSKEQVDVTINSIKEIERYSETQSKNTEEVVRLVKTISSSSQNVTANVEEVSSITEIQSESVSDIVKSIDSLKKVKDSMNLIIDEYKSGLSISDEVKKNIELALKDLKAFSDKVRNKDLNEVTRKDLLDLIAINPKYLFAGVIDSTGQGLEFTLELEESQKNISFRTYFKGAMTGKDNVSEPYIDMLTSEYCITICIPFRVNNIIKGACLLDLRL